MSSKLPEGVKLHPKFINYGVTKDGRVWSTISNKWLKPGLSCGRLTVSLGRNETELVHRLVLEAFVGFCPEGMECCHADDNPLNNSLSNLRWDTRSNNMKEGYRNGKYKPLPGKGDKSLHHTLSEKDVRIIVYMCRTGDFTQREVAKIYGVTPSCICGIMTKRSWKHIWSN